MAHLIPATTVYQSLSQPLNPSGTVRFDGRMLFLSQSASVIQRQLLGEDIALEEALPLRSDISTDEIGTETSW